MLRKIQKTISIVILLAFVTSSVKSPAYAQSYQEGMMPHLPPPGVMVQLSPEFTPAHLLGITIHPDNALQFDFLIHKGDQELEGDQKKEEYKKLVKYFLASLTIPDEDQWVNLSPYEHDRIIKDDFGKTEMGRDLLAQDYMLKQITSSLIYPEEGLGRKFWDKIYERAWKEYHTTDVPVNTFNKVWIVPDQAYVYESGNTAYILKSHLKVMLEEDYMALSHVVIPAKAGIQNTTHTIGSQVIREVILPELEKEVNEGKNFARLRQMYSGMILATWYKKALRESLLGKIYADKAKVKGVDQDPRTNEAIYQRYLKAFKKGVFNYIKEDVDKYTNEAIPRKYFSGGWYDFAQTVKVVPGVKLDLPKVLYIVDKASISLIPRPWGSDLGTDNAMDIATADVTPVNEKKGQEDLAMRSLKIVKVLGLISLMTFPQVDQLWGQNSQNPLQKVTTIFKHENPYLARTLSEGEVNALISKYKDRLSIGASLSYEEGRLVYRLRQFPPNGELRLHIGEPGKFSTRIFEVIGITLYENELKENDLYVARLSKENNENVVEFVKINGEGVALVKKLPDDIVWGRAINAKSKVMSAVDIAFIIDPMELPRGVAKSKPQYEEYSAGNIMGLGIDRIHGDLYVDDWHQEGRKYKERLYRNHTLDHRLVISEDIHNYQIPGDIDVGDVVGKVSKAMIAGEIIDTKNYSRSYGKRGEQPVKTRSSGSYYHLNLYHYPSTNDYTIGFSFNRAPDSIEEVEVALGPESEAVIEGVFENNGLMTSEIAYFTPPIGKRSDIADIRNAVIKILNNVKKGLGVGSMSAGGNSAMVAAPARAAGIQFLIDRGRNAVLALENDATKRIKAKQIGDLIETFIKQGQGSRALGLAQALDYYIEDKLLVNLGLSSERNEIKIVGNELQVLGIAVAEIAPIRSVIRRNMPDFVDELRKRIDKRYGLNGVEIKDAVKSAEDFVDKLKVGATRDRLASALGSLIRSHIEQKFQLKDWNLAGALEKYFKAEYEVTLGLTRENRTIEIVGNKVEVLRVEVIEIERDKRSVIDGKMPYLVDALESRIKDRFGLNEAMAVEGVGGTPPILPMPEIKNDSRPRSPDSELPQGNSTETIGDDASLKDPGELKAHFLRELRKFEDSIKAGVLKKIILQVNGALDTPVNLGELYKDDLAGLAETLAKRAINKRPKGVQGGEGENSAMSSQVAKELLVEDLGYDPKMLNALKGDDPIWNFLYENNLRIKADTRAKIKRYTMMLRGKKNPFFDRKIELLEDLLVISTHYAEASQLERLSGIKTPGGIDFNSAHLDLQIKRNGRGVPLPLVQQDMAQLNRIQGFEPEIIKIKSAVNVPIISELQHELNAL